jgi:hypothetical protein
MNDVIESVSQVIVEYLRVVDAIYGVYLDSTLGFQKIRKWIDENQQTLLRALKNRGEDISLDDLDKSQMIFGKGNPNLPEAYPLHICTQEEHKERNEKDGENYRTIGNLCLVQIYQYWEDYYRAEIAQEFGLDKDDIKLDVMGDIRLLRRSIIHHRGIALEDIERCKLLKLFGEGDEIFITENQFEMIVFQIKEGLKALASSYHGSSNSV